MTIKPDFTYSRTFHAPNLLQIAMPMGGIGAGCICLNGSGGLQDFSIKHKPATSAMPDGMNSWEAAFGILRIAGDRPQTRLLEGPIPVEKIYNLGLKSLGARQGGHEGLPRFARNRFDALYPFGLVTLEDDRLPLSAQVVGWSPLVPGDDIASGLPCSILEYSFTNRSGRPVSFEFSFNLSHLAEPSAEGGRSSRNTPIGPANTGVGGGVFYSNTAPSTREDFGSAALYFLAGKPKVKASWFRGGWYDPITALWRELSSGRFAPNDGGERAAQHAGGSVLMAGELKPGESVTCPVIIAWHFPNSNMRHGGAPTAECGPGCACETIALEPAWSPFYAGVWKDAKEVALYVADHYDTLRTRTAAFADALFSSTLPAEVLDAVSSNLAILKSPTVLRQKNGNLWAWEGCSAQSGCCHGSCTHVWNYAQALPNLFPALERTLREQELTRSIDERGHVNFRAALPDGPAPHDFHGAADGQLGGILKLYRDYQICGDRAWLAGLYPAAKRSIDFCIGKWDPDRKGLLFEPHHNTYDIEFWGPDGMCGSVYIAALCAIGLIARAVGNPDDAAPYEELAARGAKLMDEMLFNGDYYEQKVIWRESRDPAMRDHLAAADPDMADELRLLEAEGPKYQYGTGCLSDGVIGAWMAGIYGVDTPMTRENIRTSLANIFRNNFKPDLFDHANTQRPGYALGREAGLLLCSWPRGDRLTLPFPYSDEVWTGIEYQVASHLIEEGMLDEGLTIARAARSRYEGHTRNPFNEYECGSYYARAMASYALLASLSGFRYTAPDRTLAFGPKLATDQPFRCFFATAGAFGTIMLDAGELTVEVMEGELKIERLHATLGGKVQDIAWSAVASPGNTAIVTLSDSAA